MLLSGIAEHISQILLHQINDSRGNNPVIQKL